MCVDEERNNCMIFLVVFPIVQSANPPTGFTKTFCNLFDILFDEAGVLRPTFHVFVGHGFRKACLPNGQWLALVGRKQVLEVSTVIPFSILDTQKSLQVSTTNKTGLTISNTLRIRMSIREITCDCMVDVSQQIVNVKVMVLYGVSIHHITHDNFAKSIT